MKLFFLLLSDVGFIAESSIAFLGFTILESNFFWFWILLDFSSSWFDFFFEKCAVVWFLCKVLEVWGILLFSSAASNEVNFNVFLVLFITVFSSKRIL